MKPYKIKSVTPLKKPWTGTVNLGNRSVSIGRWETEQQAWDEYNTLKNSTLKNR